MQTKQRKAAEKLAASRAVNLPSFLPLGRTVLHAGAPQLLTKRSLIPGFNSPHRSLHQCPLLLRFFGDARPTPAYDPGVLLHDLLNIRVNLFSSPVGSSGLFCLVMDDHSLTSFRPYRRCEATRPFRAALGFGRSAERNSAVGRVLMTSFFSSHPRRAMMTP